MKVTEISDSPGSCFICGQIIFVGDIIIRSQLGIIPVAAHAKCDPDFEVGGSQECQSK